MKKAFWKSDWFLGLIISLFFLFTGGSTVLQNLERRAYGLGVQSSSRDAGNKIANIAIDDVSIANTIFYSNLQIDSGLLPIPKIFATPPVAQAGDAAAAIGNLIAYNHVVSGSIRADGNAAL